jgi:hypothetical protein
MLTERFNEVVEARVEKIKKVLQKKAGEYASTTDRLHNFKAAAAADDTNAVKALWGMYLKHFVSVRDIVHKFQQGSPSSYPSVELMDEKLGDSINYMILLEGLLTEAIEEAAGYAAPSDGASTGSVSASGSSKVVMSPIGTYDRQS